MSFNTGIFGISVYQTSLQKVWHVPSFWITINDTATVTRDKDIHPMVPITALPIVVFVVDFIPSVKPLTFNAKCTVDT